LIVPVVEHRPMAALGKLVEDGKIHTPTPGEMADLGKAL
jgi:hypothetical protein